MSMTTQFPRYLTAEEAARILGVSDARVSLWIGEGKLSVAARSEYAGFLLHLDIVESEGRRLAAGVPAKLRMIDPEPSETCRECGRALPVRARRQRRAKAEPAKEAAKKAA
jgi:hypothetical protein